MLAIRITATPKSVDIQGVIPIEATPTQLSNDGMSLLTIEQTSGCLIVNDYNSSTGKETVSIIPG